MVAQGFHTIRPRWWQPKLGAIGEAVTDLDDLRQTLRVILLTPKRSIPHRPDFGVGIQEYLDRPQAQAFPILVAEIHKQLERFEPRIQVSRVETLGDQALGTVVIRVHWTLRANGHVGTVEVGSAA